MRSTVKRLFVAAALLLSTLGASTVMTAPAAVAAPSGVCNPVKNMGTGSSLVLCLYRDGDLYWAKAELDNRVANATSASVTAQIFVPIPFYGDYEITRQSCAASTPVPVGKIVCQTNAVQIPKFTGTQPYATTSARIQFTMSGGQGLLLANDKMYYW